MRDLWRGPDEREAARTGFTGPDALRDGGATERQLERARQRERGRRPRLDRKTRERAALRDLGAFRSVALKDLIEERFSGNRFAARAIVDSLKRGGLVVETVAFGPRGGEFRVVSLTDKGLARVRAGDDGARGQLWWRGGVQKRQAVHDAAVYRAAMASARELREKGRAVRRVVIDAELKSRIARAVESARARGGEQAARAERQRVAAELGLPVSRGAVQIPDARLEWEDERGDAGRVDIEVATKHYRAAAVKAKQAAGFQVFGAGGSGGSGRSALRGLRPAGSWDAGGGGTGRFSRDEEWFSF